MAIRRLSSSQISTAGRGKSSSALAGYSPAIDEMDLIQRTTVGSGGAANINFSSIPQTYQHLQIRLTGRTSRSNVDDNAFIRLNGDSGSNYAWHTLYGNGSSAVAFAATSATYGQIVSTSAATATASSFGCAIIDILDYTVTTKNTTIRSLTGFDSNGNGVAYLGSTLWLNTAAVTSIVLANVTSANWVQNTTVSLYGVIA